MTKPRRLGTETSGTRSLLLDVTEQIMLDDGYAAVSSRRIAKQAGVTPALVHYYFATLDDLFLAVVRRRAERQLERQKSTLFSPQPLRALWAASTDPAGTGLLLELMALANHRKAIRSELAAHAEQFRKIQLDALAVELERFGFDPAEVPPVSILLALTSIAQTLVLEESIGMETGLAETAAAVERFLARVEDDAIAD